MTQHEVRVSRTQGFLMEAGIVLGLLLLAGLYHLGRWQGAWPFVMLRSDAANIAGFVAAWEHPELFARDALLGDPQNFRFYWTIHLPLLRLLGGMLGDYGSAFVALLGPHVFLQSLGFYLLGRAVLRQRLWAVLLTFITLMQVDLNLSTSWGVMGDPIPRFTFQALLPYLLAAAYHWRSRPAVWPWIMVSAGLLMYVHPVSAPAWGFALWLGLWTCQPSGWSRSKRLKVMVGVGAIFLVVTLPFVVHYLQHHARAGTTEIEYRQLYDIVLVRIDQEFLNAVLALQRFLTVWGHRWVYWGWALVGACLMARCGGPHIRKMAPVGMWFLGLLGVSLLLPLGEQLIAQTSERLPVQIDLVRGLRYTVPIMLLCCLWPLAEMAQHWRHSHPARARWTGAAGVVLVLLWMGWHPPVLAAKGLRCLSRGFMLDGEVCIPQRWHERLALLQAVRQEVPVGSRIFPLTSIDTSLAIRYYAYRPLAYVFKDGGALIYSNHRELLRWFEIYKALHATKVRSEFQEKLTGYIQLARASEAAYIVLEKGSRPLGQFERPEAAIVWRSRRFVLLKLQPHAL